MQLVSWGSYKQFSVTQFKILITAVTTTPLSSLDRVYWLHLTHRGYWGLCGQVVSSSAHLSLKLPLFLFQFIFDTLRSLSIWLVAFYLRFQPTHLQEGSTSLQLDGTSASHSHPFPSISDSSTNCIQAGSCIAAWMSESVVLMLWYMYVFLQYVMIVCYCFLRANSHLNFPPRDK